MVFRVIHEDRPLLRPRLRTMTIQRCRCAVVISSKVSKRAVLRNRLRRLLHNHLRTRLEAREDLSGRWLLIGLKPEALNATPSQLLEECDSLLSSAGLGT